MSHEGWDPATSAGDRGASRSRGRRRDRSRIHDEHWWRLNRTLGFYGFVTLAGAKVADAVTTAVGVRYVPGIVELNPFADAVFAGNGTFAGLAVLTFATVAVATVAAEALAVEIRRRFGLNRLALLAKAAIYGSLTVLFGAVAVNNSLLISEQVQSHLADLFVAAAVVH